MTRVALVTGGARGLGAAIATRLAQDHTAVVLADLDATAAADTAAKIAAGSEAAVSHGGCDVRDSASVEAVFDLAERQHGTVTTLVNVAGIGGFVPFDEMTEDQWDNCFAVNTKGTFLTCQQFLRRRPQGDGAIVNISSVSARRADPNLAHYGAAKAAVLELTHVVAQLGATRGVRANAVMPGIVWSDMWRDGLAWLQQRVPELASLSVEDAFGAVVSDMVPMKRPQTTGDIAELVAFLVSDRAGNVTGQTIAVDGGMVMT